MISINDYVVPIGQNFPVGVIVEINGDNTATVLWGISDKKEFKENVQLDKLEIASVIPS